MDEKNIASATRWNTLAQIMPKILSPLSNIILAHILAPDVFGVVASITIVISFTDVFTEAGFQKYIVQHELKEDEDINGIINVAFVTNLIMSIVLFGVIVLFRKPISALIGTPGKELALVIAAIALPLTSFSTIQAAVYQRNFQYKPLFLINAVGTLLPLVSTIPLALLGAGYWSMIIGQICSYLYKAVALTIKSEWKPRLWFSFRYLKSMINFCGWAMCESIMVWLSTNGDIFIVSTMLTSYYLGIYKTSMSMVNVLLRMASSAILPVTYAVISRLQNDKPAFTERCYDSQRSLACIVLPIGVGVFIFRDLGTLIVLGSNWMDASLFLGLWSLSSSFVIAFHYICDDIYRAVGKPKYSFITHAIMFFATVITVYYFAQKSFDSLTFARSIVALIIILVDFYLLKKSSGISMSRFFWNCVPIIFAVIGMGVVGILLKRLYSSIYLDVLNIIVCGAVYLIILIIQPEGRKTLNCLKRMFFAK